jgi:hypothetical protein
MSDKNKLSEQEIDEIVIAQADDDDAWEEPIDVKPVIEKPPAHDA